MIAQLQGICIMEISDFVFGNEVLKDFPTNRSSEVRFVGKFSFLIFENPTKRGFGEVFVGKN